MLLQCSNSFMAIQIKLIVVVVVVVVVVAFHNIKRGELCLKSKHIHKFKVA